VQRETKTQYKQSCPASTAQKRDVYGVAFFFCILQFEEETKTKNNILKLNIETESRKKLEARGI
jgi:hypothetical protein